MNAHILSIAWIPLSLSLAAGAAAEPAEDLSRELQQTQQRLAELERRLEPLEAGANVRAPGPRNAAAAFNPDIGMIGDLVYFNSESGEDLEGNDKLSVRELELVMGADIDPYSRFDSTITFSDFEDVAVEEAYLTHWGLPAEVRGRLGRIRPKLGKSTQVHRDQLDTADYPLVVQEYLGIEGIYRTGVELNRLTGGWSDALTHEWSFGLLEGGAGEGGTVFGETRRRPTLTAHLKNAVDLSDATSFELGGTWAQGSSNEDDDLDVALLGLDATLIHYLDATRRLKLQGEFFWQDRDQRAEVSGHGHEEEERAEVEEEDHDDGLEENPAFRENPYGYYGLADLRLSPRWGVGGRFDWVQPVNREGDGGEDIGMTGYLTFYQSEFARMRAQVQHVDLAEGGDDTRFWLQVTVAIGVHKHALQ